MLTSYLRLARIIYVHTTGDARGVGKARVERSRTGRVVAAAVKWSTMLEVSPEFRPNLQEGLLNLPMQTV